MNEVQIGIIAVVAIVVLVIVIYYIYQENKFKKMIENNFNQATGDVLHEEKGLVFDNDDGLKTGYSESHKDISHEAPPLKQNEINFDPLLGDNPDIPAVATENPFFIEYDKVSFPFLRSGGLAHIIDIVFEKPTKIKLLPEITQFIQKPADYFILDKASSWQAYQKGQKYVLRGIKLVIELVDRDGVISPLQLENIYSELAKFALHHEGHMRQSDSELEIRRIQQQLRTMKDVELELELFMINREAIDFRHLSKYFNSNGFVFRNGFFEYKNHDETLFYVADENGKPLNELSAYKVLAIISKLHHHNNPLAVIDKIFGFAEHYMQYFESRLLTTNKMVMSEKEYNALEKQVTNYINSCKRQGVELGSALVKKIFP